MFVGLISRTTRSSSYVHVLNISAYMSCFAAHRYNFFILPRNVFQISTPLEDYKIRVGFVRSAKSYHFKIIEFTITPNLIKIIY